MNIIYMLLFIISFVLYYLFYSTVIKGNKYFFLILFISFVSIVTYLLGIINLLPYSPYIIIFVSIILAILYRNKLTKINIKELIPNDLLIYYLITLIWLFIMTRNAGLSHWDDFSHWYRIIKIMHFDSSFPTTDELLYPTYFPGTACFIYFLTRFIPFNTANCLLAQGIIIFGASSTLLSTFKNHNNIIIKNILTIIATICMCSIYDTFYLLRVDNLVGLLALSTLFFIKTSETKFDSLLLLLLLTFMPLAKVSGAIFSILLAIYYIYERKLKILSNIYLLLVPLLFMALYLIRNNIVYPSIDEGNHVFSISSFINTSNSKGISLIIDITKYFIYSLFNVLKSPQIATTWICLLIIFLDKSGKNFKLSIILFVLYAIALLGMYIFSMNNADANGSYLVSINRYISTITIFFIGIAFTSIFNSKYSIPLTIIILLIFMITYNFDFIYSHKINKYTNKMWFDLKEKCEEKDAYNTTNYLIIFNKNDYPDDSTHKAQSLASVYFRSNYVYAIEIQKIKDHALDETARSYIDSANEIIWLTDQENIDLDSY